MDDVYIELPNGVTRVLICYKDEKRNYIAKLPPETEETANEEGNKKPSLV